MSISLGSYYKKNDVNVVVADGGTDANDAATAGTNLGVDLTVSSHSTLDHTGFLGVGKVVQQIRSQTAAFLSIPSVIPFDGTVPENGEGAQVLTATITPQNASNILLIEFSGHLATPGSGAATSALFVDGGTTAIAATGMVSVNGNSLLLLRHFVTAGSTASRIYRIGTAANNGTSELNSQGATVTSYGGFNATCLTVTEYTP